jgi:sugar phosphate isomerase/epimerase
MKDCIDMVAELGGQILGIVPSTVGKITPMSTPKEEWRWAVEGLREVAYYAGEKGVRPGIEPINRFDQIVGLVGASLARASLAIHARNDYSWETPRRYAARL